MPRRKSERLAPRATYCLGLWALFLATFGVPTVFAQDPPIPPDGGTNGAPVTNNFVAQPFPLNLLATCVRTDSPVTLSTWADMDSAVAAGFDGLPTSLMIVYPPGNFVIPQDGGLFVFSSTGEIAANTNLLQPTTAMGVPLWKMGVVETQLTSRAWVYRGASDGTNSIPFRTNNTPASFDGQAWVRSVWGNPPAYLSGAELTQWYADRDRSRAILGLTLISDNDFPTLQAALQAAQANATNAPSGDPSLPVLPADTNSLAFATVWSSPDTLNTWIYSPAARPVAVLARDNLAGAATDWRMRGNFQANQPFNFWSASLGSPQCFFKSGFVDQDSDGDGIPDFIENSVTGTNPYQWDSAGTSLGDYLRFFIYGLSTTNRDANADGMDDEEAILAGLDPHAWNTGASAASIRYYYDADDRVAGVFADAPANATSYRFSPAGNHATTSERSAP